MKVGVIWAGESCFTFLRCRSKRETLSESVTANTAALRFENETLIVCRKDA